MYDLFYYHLIRIVVFILTGAELLIRCFVCKSSSVSFSGLLTSGVSRSYFLLFLHLLLVTTFEAIPTQDK